MAKNFTLGNKAYPPVTITNEIGKGKPFFSIFHDYSSTALFVHENRATFATH